ncbi:MAG: hypothetical protein IH819_05280 [Bacteroidetes bacterium]|nr:hypothetical protein [Bacteroidota bacterium]
MLVITSDHGSETSSFKSSLEENLKYSKQAKPGKFFKAGKYISKKIPNHFQSVQNLIRETYLRKSRQIAIKKGDEKMKKIENLPINPYEKRLLRSSIKPKYDVYDDRFRVPLLFYGYPLKKSRIISQQIRSIDIFPTIFDLIRLDLTQDTKGNSLLPLIHGNYLEEKPALLESIGNWEKSNIFNTIGIRTSEFKFFRDRHDPKKDIHLYDLKEDPLEEKNIASKNEDVVKHMENILQDILKDSLLSFEKSETDFDEEETKMVEEELKKLGYI